MNAPKPPGEAEPQPDPIEVQKDLLAVIQMGHMNRLRVIGLAERASATIGRDTSQLGNVVVALGELTTDSGRIRQLKVVFNNYGLTDTNEYRQTQEVVIAQEMDGAVFPKEGFSEEDAFEVASMVAGLEEVKDAGILPNLDASLTYIAQPGTFMRR